MMLYRERLLKGYVSPIALHYPSYENVSTRLTERCFSALLAKQIKKKEKMNEQ